jgi:hypothetical protein
LTFIWVVLIFGAAAGVLGNIVYASLTTPNFSLNDLGHLALISWFTAHLLLVILILLAFIALNIIAYSAHHHRQHLEKQQQLVKENALVDIARGITDIGQGVREALEKKDTSPAPILPTPSTTPANQDIVAEGQVFTIPYRRNPFFTGREQLLADLHTHFTRAAAAAITQPQAITGLGGIGKTQLAVEYAYRYRNDYHHILWANASDRATLGESFVKLARELQLPKKEQQDQNIIIEAVKKWLSTHDQWLLILDNADDLSLATHFMPSGDKGHILLTTREAATGRIAKGFAVDKMSEAEGVLFLLRRANILTSPDATIAQASETEQKLAAEIVREMDGLPLALEQAGAYIEENQSSLADYLKAYRQRQASLLARQGRTSRDYPNSVATTWSLSFQQVEQNNSTAAELLRFLAFLAPDAIPEELIVEGASEPGPKLKAIESDETLLNEAIGTLRRYSLVQRNIDKHLLAIHRLVQAILKADMTQEVKRQWAERTVRAVNKAFPDVKDINQWPKCERYLPHALMCAELIDTYDLEFTEAARLLNQTAFYLNDHAQYEQAEPLCQRALAIFEEVPGPNHPSTITVRGNYDGLLEAMKRKRGG